MATIYQQRLARTCIDCGATLPPERRGFYCETHGRESPRSPGSASAPTIHVTATVEGDQWILSYPCSWCPPRRGHPIVHTHPGGPVDAPPADGWRVSHCPLRGQHGAPSAYTMITHPQAEAQARRSADGVWILTIICPYCGRAHSHGGGSDQTPDLGYRRPHCLTGSHPDYELIAAPLPDNCPGCYVETAQGRSYCSGCKS
jgi:hypothetical protein